MRSLHAGFWAGERVTAKQKVTARFWPLRPRSLHAGFCAGERVTESIREHSFNHHTTQKAGLPNASRLYNGRDHINTHLQTCLDFSFNASLRGTTYS
ncbi:hypothetical protein FEI14_09795 [Lacticaseibacillus zeae]|uniref:Uncharacterized protein n=1 Tax=Lacticaseibacillus zeae TaxID=57037 RepID=A0A5R8LTU8_LACZE|nr:hypothetical protein FEI14_09795 [Lacticaseibacillus zeae]